MTKKDEKPKSEKDVINNQLRVEQMSALDIYFEMAENDQSMMKFVENMYARIGRFLNKHGKEDI